LSYYKILIIFVSFTLNNLAFSISTPPSKLTASPKMAWGDFYVDKKITETSWQRQTLLYLPNRFLDLVDALKFDLGAGFSFGGTAKVTKYGQIGFRSLNPFSFRVGNFGRDYPFLFETSNEFGLPLFYSESKDRTVCDTEIGLGLDLFLFGGYLGICTQEALDFFSGIFLLDINDDDLE